MKVSKHIVTIFIVLFMMNSLYAAEKRGIVSEAKDLVERAIDYAKANGEEKALKEIGNPNGKFVKYDLYVFVYDLKGVLMAHPHAPTLVGKNRYKVKDCKGKPFRKQIVDTANSQGSGWVDYTYMNPITKREEFKLTYFERMGNLIFCCGVYPE